MEESFFARIAATVVSRLDHHRCVHGLDPLRRERVFLQFLPDRILPANQDHMNILPPGHGLHRAFYNLSGRVIAAHGVNHDPHCLAHSGTSNDNRSVLSISYQTL